MKVAVGRALIHCQPPGTLHDMTVVVPVGSLTAKTTTFNPWAVLVHKESHPTRKCRRACMTWPVGRYNLLLKDMPGLCPGCWPGSRHANSGLCQTDAEEWWVAQRRAFACMSRDLKLPTSCHRVSISWGPPQPCALSAEVGRQAAAANTAAPKDDPS